MAPSFHLLLSKVPCCVALILAITLCFRFYLLDGGDHYRCRALQSEGRWIKQASAPDVGKQFQHWQPPGCMFHEYHRSEIEECLACNNILFLGDSTVRQVFWATVKKLNKTHAEDALATATKHSNVTFSQGCVTVDFVWDPFLNSTDLLAQSAFTNRSLSMVSENPDSSRIVSILIGGGLWHAKDLGDDYLQSFQTSINTIAQRAGDPRSGINAKFVRLPHERRQVSFAPVLSPEYLQLSPSRQDTITHEKVREMNSALNQAALIYGVEVLWGFSLMSAGSEAAFEEDGIHVVENIASRQADLLLNLRCNDSPQVQRYPFKQTCCAKMPRIGPVRTVIGSLTVSTSIVGGCLSWYKASKGIKISKPLWALVVFTSTLCYCFAADRTWIFEKVNKTIDEYAFLWIVAIVFLPGILSVRGSLGNGAAFMPREQTEEWKGWMQLVILAYHYTDMSKILWVYEIVRLLVASYLFMTGFGHTVYFYKTNDFSFRRVASVLIRLNLLTYCLSLVMGTDYEFYYFPALSSFWYMVVYLTCRIGRDPQALLTYLVVKIIASAILVTTAVQLPGVLEQIAKTLKDLFNINVDVHEFRFRLSLDLYIVPIGMLAALLYLQLSTQEPCTQAYLHSSIRKVSSTFHLLAVTSSLVLLPTFFILIHRASDKYAYNRHWHPYLSFIPVLSFIILRNSHPILLKHHSRLFAWIGRISLETFVLQYHIWLAGNAKGRLRLGLFGQDTTNGFLKHHHLARDWPALIEFVVISGVFLWTSWGASNATAVLVTWLVGSSSQRHLLPRDDERGAKAVVARTTSRSTIARSLWRIASTPGKELEDWQVKVRVLGLVAVMWVVSLMT